MNWMNFRAGSLFHVDQGARWRGVVIMSGLAGDSFSDNTDDEDVSCSVPVCHLIQRLHVV